MKWLGLKPTRLNNSLIIDFYIQLYRNYLGWFTFLPIQPLGISYFHLPGIQQSVSAKDIVSSILFAANRKINRSASSSKAFAQPHASPLSMSVSTSKISGSPPSSTAPASSNEQSAPSVPPPHSPVAKSISQSVLLSGKIATSLQGEGERGEPWTFYIIKYQFRDFYFKNKL